ncbi:ABC transporter ATP-binding protein [Rickettsiella endosymbiont of Dermanyssus gallinae]|uniref:ABC transporter ATP-binding protein n=1 Tax=Rickettsiella endosymbiont of Dermanyssus gallinae TaxID=2856608 RepID=UPI001C52D5EF|nr:ATP-binding cassette domain-containing protein [Rickettsiella endosymbiont of Dermanyssus gallinae]
MNASDLVIKLDNVKVSIAGQWIHKGINLEVKRREIVAIVGSSGSGKSTILREILLLLTPTSGTIEVFGKNLKKLSSAETIALKCRWGVLFQQSALFTSLTVLENIAFPLHEHSQLDNKTINELALLKLSAVGLPLSAAIKYPSELSGGMLKRTALARALVMDPELLLLDELTAGLDPQGAEGFDKLLLTLRDILGLTILMVTHDLDTLWQITDKVAFLSEGTVLAFAPMEELTQSTDPAIRTYFQGPRGRITKQFYGESHGI